MAFAGKETQAHAAYLTKMGFVKENGVHMKSLSSGIPSIAKSGSAACPSDRIPPYPIMGKTNSGGGQRPPPVNSLPTNRKAQWVTYIKNGKKNRQKTAQNERFSVLIVRVTRLKRATICS